MAFDPEKAVVGKDLKALADRIKADYATKAVVGALETKVNNLVSAGGEPNVIEGVKVNGTALTPDATKNVEVSVPTKVGDLTNDQQFQSLTEVTALINALRTQLMGEGVPEAYDTFKELADYIAEHKEVSDALTAAIGGKVDKVEGKGLSTEDFTSELLAKLNGISAGATKVEASATQGNIKVNGTEVQVVKFATDAEIQEMLDDVFGASAT